MFTPAQIEAAARAIAEAAGSDQWSMYVDTAPGSDQWSMYVDTAQAALAAAEAAAPSLPDEIAGLIERGKAERDAIREGTKSIIRELKADRNAIRAKTIEWLAQKMEDDGEPYVARKLRALAQTDEGKPT